MNRRAFLRSLGLVAPAALVRPTYFLPPVGGWRTWAYTKYIVSDVALNGVSIPCLQRVRRAGDFWIVEHEWRVYPHEIVKIL